MKNIDWNEFLCREALVAPDPEAMESLRKAAVMVVGAGGSIGRQLVLRLGRMGVGRLIALESCESRLSRVKRELEGMGVWAAYRLGDVGNRRVVEEVFANECPSVVFHAAAYKQVPLLEEQPLAAIENNVFGTGSLIEQAGNARMILVSTDKAVDPVSMLGATKRLAERMVLGTGGVVARLGNVLGSRDSVTEMFSQQIGEGKALTVTDGAARRYFLTVDEAVQLLLHAAVGGTGLVLPDVNESHGVLELAEFLAGRLAPGVGFAARWSGMRAGEKLEEAFLTGEELTRARRVNGVVRVDGDWTWTEGQAANLKRLRESTRAGDLQKALRWLCALVPEYAPSATVLGLAERDGMQQVSR